MQVYAECYNEYKNKYDWIAYFDIDEFLYINDNRCTNIKQFLSEYVDKHSKKPEEIRNRIDKMFSKQSRIELFARQQVEGWDCWGNEV